MSPIGSDSSPKAMLSSELTVLILGDDVVIVLEDIFGPGSMVRTPKLNCQM